MIKQKMVSKLLELKEHTRGQKEAEAKKAREKLKFEQEKLDLIEKTHQGACAEFSDRQMKGSLAVRELELYYSYLKHLAKQIEQQKKIVAIRIRELEDRQKAVLGAYKEHRLVEILRNKLLHRDAREALQIEQKEVDYTFISRKAQR